MKKVLSILLGLVLCFSLCACGSKSSESTVSSEYTESVEDKVRNAVETTISVYVKLSYNTTGVPTIICYIDSSGTNEYTVSGKVTVRDKYGDSYTGKYDAVVVYNPETDSCSVSSYDLGDLYQD